MPPTPKNVLMAIADRADDDGLAWPSIPGLCEATCYSRTAVIDALKWLEQAGLLTIQKSIGRPNRFVILIEQVRELVNRPVREPYPHQSGSRTGTGGAPVREADGTSTAGAPPPVREAYPPVREPDPNHQEPPMQHQREPSRGSARKSKAALPDPQILLPDVSGQVLHDWQAVRAAKKAGPITATVASVLKREAEKLGIGAQEAIEICCARGWQSISASWPSAQAEAAKTRPGDVSLEALTAGVQRRLGIPQRSAANFAAVDYSEGLPR